MPKPRNARLETATARLRLEPRRKPYWFTVARCVALGYRRNATGGGSWSARATQGSRQWIKIIARADDLEPANGKDVLNYYDAIAMARVVARQEESVGEAAPTDRPATLSEALDLYADDLAARGRNPYNAKRARFHLAKYPGLLSRPVALLGQPELAKYRADLIKRAPAATANRTFTCIKAACELAAKADPRINSNRAWKLGLATLPGANVARNVILPLDVVRALVAAAYALDHQFGLLVETSAVTGGRLSQLARVEVSDLQADQLRLMVPQSNKGNGRKKPRPIPVLITAALASALTQAAMGRAGNAPLLLRANGLPWPPGSNLQRRPFRAIAASCGLDPGAVTLIALRHSSIVNQLLKNVPIRLVAANHDTSVGVIEANYSKHISGHGDALVRVALADMEPAAPVNVVALRKAR